MGERIVQLIIIGAALIIVSLGAFHVLKPDSPAEEIAEEILKQETGLDIQVNEK